MGELKATPGPWYVGKDRTYETAVNSDDRLICLVHGGAVKSKFNRLKDPDCQQREINAHLIAAAPDLYEALSGLLQAYNRVSPAEAKPAQVARAALAKARGEAP